MNIGLVIFRQYPLISPDITLFQWSAPLHTIYSCRHSFLHTTWKYYYEIVSDILSDWYSFWHLYLPYLLTCLLSSGILSGISSEISLWSRSLTGHLNGPGHVKRRGSFTTSPRHCGLRWNWWMSPARSPASPAGPVSTMESIHSLSSMSSRVRWVPSPAWLGKRVGPKKTTLRYSNVWESWGWYFGFEWIWWFTKLESKNND